MYKPKFILLLILCLVSFQAITAQFDIPKTPEFQTSVYDYINLLSSTEKSNLENKLVKYSDTTSTQIVVAIISTTKGENIMYLATQWAHKWGVGGSKEKDNGIFILLARDDRKIAIATGYGVEHLLTDAMSRRIIERDIIPYFKKNDYYGGLNRGADAVFEVMSGAYQGSRLNQPSDFPVGLLFFIIIIFLVILIAISKKRNGGGNGGHRSAGHSILDAIILSNSGRGGYRRSSGGFGGGGFGGSSGGGFGGGFGGGGFGGGGASGGW
ncbi:TPM domain-containing protein [Lacinutrix iliipiscaria]|uniref:TPM domain-containing protein n=1 Tax=Lacinutrix iliipiscaria TaxID=1230532 RepID=A0ABW5WT80_9FLAO